MLSSYNRLSILIFHSIRKEYDPYSESISVGFFDQICGMVKRFFSIISLEEAVDNLALNKPMPLFPLCITFDDGYKDNLELALPVLKKHGLSATFFIASGFMDNGWMWNDGIIEAFRKTRLDQVDLADIGFSCIPTDSQSNRLEATKKVLPEVKYLNFNTRVDIAKKILELAQVPPPKGMMMTPDQILEMDRQGMTIGGHTIHHPILMQEKSETAYQEIVNNKSELESLLNKEVFLFAYPNGQPGLDYDENHVNMVRKAGYKAAVSTAWTAVNSTDIFQLPRFTPWDKAAGKFVARLGMQYLKRTLSFD